MKKITKYWQSTLYIGMIASALMAVGCSSDNDDDDTDDFSVSGTVTGLSGTVVLQNNGKDNLSITSDGSFSFPNEIDSGDTYAVTVLTQPNGQTCTVANSTGVANADITDVAVTCSSITYSVGVTVEGLNGTVVLQNNDTDDLSITSSGDFVFATQVAAGATYDVTVSSQPDDQTCTVTNGTGTATTDISNITVSCATSVYKIGGNISGLDGTVVLQNNGGDDLTLNSDGDFEFETEVVADGTYEVTVLTQPTGQTCMVTNGSGTATADVDNIDVACADNKIIFMSATLHDGSLGGISGADAICMADANYPGSGTYKALLANSTDRVACTTANCSTGTGEHTDWVLAANTPYVRSNGTTLIAQTNSLGIFSFPLNESTVDSDDTSWTGLATDWTTSGNMCGSWVSNSSSDTGSVGQTNATSTDAIHDGDVNCDVTAQLYCVEQ